MRRFWSWFLGLFSSPKVYEVESTDLRIDDGYLFLRITTPRGERFVTKWHPAQAHDVSDQLLLARVEALRARGIIAE